jgi:hypothetical protein
LSKRGALPLGNPYFPSECKLITIRFAGHTNDRGMVCTSSTTIKLKLIPKRRR